MHDTLWNMLCGGGPPIAILLVAYAAICGDIYRDNRKGLK